ncbi:MAG: hypothetical protein L0Y32_00065 [Nevskiales bacterium]|nr:hypothetical protein [Nevskiales bacterium]
MPETLHVLRYQRIRWQRGLAESLRLNRRLLFGRRGGTPGWLAFPFQLVFELFSPVIELGGYAFLVICWMQGLIVFEALLAFLLLSIATGMLLSITALLLEEMSFHIYPKQRQLFALCGVAFLENIGYRQLVTIWRLMGLMQWLMARKVHGGRMPRKGTWHKQ